MDNKHFLTLLDFTPRELTDLIQRAIYLKGELKQGRRPDLFRNKVLGMIFEKSSTRTRVSFETAMAQGAGAAIFLSSRDTQLGRGEPIEDTARVLSSMVDIITMRTFDHKSLEIFAANSTVPVINSLTDDFHPCQLLADIQTFVEFRGDIRGKTVVWVGDGNNMCQSYMNAAQQFEFELKIACPSQFQPEQALLNQHQGYVEISEDVSAMVKGAHLVVTDVWASMGQEEEAASRRAAFLPYQVNPKLMDIAHKNALFMHCLPAHRGEEVSNEMLNDPRSVIWAEAENRLHAQKALLETLIKPD